LIVPSSRAPQRPLPTREPRCPIARPHASQTAARDLSRSKCRSKNVHQERGRPEGSSSPPEPSQATPAYSKPWRAATRKAKSFVTATPYQLQTPPSEADAFAARQSSVQSLSWLQSLVLTAAAIISEQPFRSLRDDDLLQDSLRATPVWFKCVVRKEAIKQPPLKPTITGLYSRIPDTYLLDCENGEV
jgi:hypothetical protein